MNSMRNRIAGIPGIGLTMVAMLMALAGCDDRPPTGQVLASVGGDEITKRDLAVEATLTRLPPGPATLNAIVDRKLLLRRAKREHLDLTPDYLAAMRRFREATLATLAVQQAVGTLALPDDAAVRAFAHAHDWRFAGRRLVKVDDGGMLRILDTATFAHGDDGRRLATAGIGTRVMLEGRALRVVSSRPFGQTPADSLAAPRETLMEQRREQLVRHLIEAERSSVRVRYQSGFGTIP